MKIYAYDRSWAGMSVVVANSPEEAVQMLKVFHESGHKHPLTVEDLTEYEITHGLIIDNSGDA